MNCSVFCAVQISISRCGFISGLWRALTLAFPAALGNTSHLDLMLLIEASKKVFWDLSLQSYLVTGCWKLPLCLTQPHSNPPWTLWEPVGASSWAAGGWWWTSAGRTGMHPTRWCAQGSCSLLHSSYRFPLTSQQDSYCVPSLPWFVSESYLRCKWE